VFCWITNTAPSKQTDSSRYLLSYIEKVIGNNLKVDGSI
jgi:hypothetical protein